MIFSKMSSKTALIALAAISAFSCSERENSQIKNADNATFYVDSVAGSFSTVEMNSQSLASKKLLSMTACLKDNAASSSVNNLKFEVVAGDVSTIKQTDNKGCIYWQELVDYDPSGVEKNVYMARTVRAVESHSGEKSFSVSVNPWGEKMAYFPQVQAQSNAQLAMVSYKAKDLKEASNVGYDYDFAIQLSEKVSLGSGIRRQSEITELRLNYRNIDYGKFEVDSNLNLTASYNYVTNLSISLLRQSLSELSPIKIKSGLFQFHLVLLKETANLKNPKASDVLSAVQFSGKPYGDAGIIQESINLKFKNIAALASRMNVLMTVSSLDNPQLFEDQTFEGALNKIETNQNLAIGLIPNTANARLLYQAYMSQPTGQEAQSNVAQKLKDAGFAEIKQKMVSFDKTKYLFMSENVNVDLNQIIQKVSTDRSLTSDEKAALCAAFVQNTNNSLLKKAYQQCLLNPESSIDAKVTDMVVSVNSKNVSVSIGRPEKLAVTANFDLVENTSRERGQNLDARASGSIGAEIGASLGWGNTKPDPTPAPKIPIAAKASASAKVGIGGEIYYVSSYSRGEKDSTAVSISSTEELTSEPLLISMDVSSQKCLLITAMSGSALDESSKKVKLATGRYICDSRVERTNKTEVYYFMNHNRGLTSSSLNDQNSAQANPLRLFVRGTNMHNYLRSILSDNKYKFSVFLRKMTAQHVLDDASSLMTQEMPGLLSSGQKDVFAN